MSERVRDGVRELGLDLQCPSLRRYAATVTAIAIPAPLAPPAVRDGLKARGILTAAGLARFQQSAFRIGHMGDIRLADVERTLGGLAEILASSSATSPSAVPA
jgi:aspartate aminotransferase-like enzyme